MIFNNINTKLVMGDKHKIPCQHARRRSNMMLNPLNLKHLNMIDKSSADMITLNLEDAIAPSRKKEALDNIALFLSNLETSQSFIIVRTNPLDRGGDDEIRLLNDFSFDAVRIPKVKSQMDVENALGLLSEKKELHISVETKEAFNNLSYFAISERFTTANLGILDLLSSLGLPQSLVHKDNPTIDYILAKFLVDAKTAGIHPISFMFQDYNDTETFTNWCRYEKCLGYTSKACMGPKQVDIANDIFGIDSFELEKAAHIKRTFEAHEKENINGFMDDRYGFIDEPIYRDSLLILKNIEDNR